MASLETMPAPAGLVQERRVRAEWGLLEQMAGLNPTRLAGLRWVDSAFALTLRETPALRAGCGSSGFGGVLDEHRVRVAYPRFFPAVPLELYLGEPVLHPNVHPVTGFVCLWDRHRVSNTVEHALHKTVAMLGWRLLNAEAHHVMQPEALGLDGEALAERLAAAPLTGVEHRAEVVAGANPPKRRRLS